MIKKFLIPVMLVVLAGCKTETKTSEPVAWDEEEAYRPNYHFTPAENWMNDPNGMFYMDGTYHLYFQYYPDGNKWGPMHWGHATTTDLMNWEEHPIALYPDSLGYIFSGSAVVDRNNVSGLGDGKNTPVIAFYTSHDPEKAEAGKVDVETQSIAYSLDQGMSWTKYERNPVIANPGTRDFRDPKVSWDSEHQQWIMALAAGQEIRFYRSGDLKRWEELSSFGEDVGGHGGVWECPDLFQLPVEGTDEKKWVLLVSINPGGPNGGSATQYFVGDFDGEKFTMDEDFANAMAKDHRFWIDFGRDNYAGVTWSGIPETNGRKVFIGWMSNWDYAQEVPTEKWRSAMTIPREFKLYKDSTYQLASVPATEFNSATQSVSQWKDIMVDEPLLVGEGADLLDRAVLNFHATKIATDTLRLRLSNAAGEWLDIGYSTGTATFFVDRRESGKTEFSEKFAPAVTTAPRVKTGDLQATIFLDKTSVEAFYDQGRSVMTEIFFPTKPYDKVEWIPGNGKIKFKEMSLEKIDLK